MTGLQYWHRRRAHSRLPRVRAIPNYGSEPTISNILAYKAGMTNALLVDDSAEAQGIEVSRACTVLEIPPMEVYGIRLYGKDSNTGYKNSKIEVIDKTQAQKLNIKNPKHVTSIESAKSKLKEFSDVSVLIAAYPGSLNTGQRHPMRFESSVMGNSMEERFDAAAKLLGKTIDPKTYFIPGEYIDITSITKGKGWQGAIKRHGAKRQSHKATQKIRHVGPLGSFSPGKVFFNVPRPGQMGFNYRTEQNKRIIKIGSKDHADEINKKSGFKGYGVIKNEYMVVEGSIPGPATRLVRLRKSINNRNAKAVKEPKIVQIAS